MEIGNVAFSLANPAAARPIKLIKHFAKLISMALGIRNQNLDWMTRRPTWSSYVERVTDVGERLDNDPSGARYGCFLPDLTGLARCLPAPTSRAIT